MPLKVIHYMQRQWIKSSRKFILMWQHVQQMQTWIGVVHRRVVYLININMHLNFWRKHLYVRQIILHHMNLNVLNKCNIIVCQLLLRGLIAGIQIIWYLDVIADKVLSGWNIDVRDIAYIDGLVQEYSTGFNSVWNKPSICQSQHNMEVLSMNMGRIRVTLHQYLYGYHQSNASVILFFYVSMFWNLLSCIV